MDTLKNPNASFTVMSVLGAIIITGMLLIFLSNLSTVIKPENPDTHPYGIVIPDIKPPEPPDPARDEEIKPRQLTPQERTLPNKINYTPETLTPVSGAGPGYLDVMTKPTFEPPHAPFVREILIPSEVDRAPSILRAVNPVYPFSAKSKGIEGRVMLRFVVDENGYVNNPEIIESEPAGMFEESALAAIVKYRFRPAMLGKEPVKCIVNLPIGFRLDQ